MRDSLARLDIASKTHMVIFVLPLRFFHCVGDTLPIARSADRVVIKPEAPRVLPEVTEARAGDAHTSCPDSWAAAAACDVLPEQADAEVSTSPRPNPAASGNLTGG